MFDKLHKEIKHHLALAYPEEGCGLIVDYNGAPIFIACRNVASENRRKIAFKITAETLREHYGKILAIVHSHTDGSPRCPSAMDMRQQISSGVPWGICPINRTPPYGELFWFGDSVGPRPPLMDRPFRHGVTDCYALIRDWYAVRGTILPEIPRDWQWWEKGADLYEGSFKNVGFRKLPQGEKLKRGDVCVVGLRSSVAHHAGVLGDNSMLLHHPGGGREFDPSKRPRLDPLDRWEKHIRFWLRHEN